MNRLYLYLFYLALSWLVAGCASPTEYIKPDIVKPTYSASDGKVRKAAEPLVLERARSAVWRQLLNGAEKRSFVIEGVNQNAWTVQLRYTGDPKDYINCGRVVSKVKTASGERNYDFPAAKAYQQYELQQSNKLYVVDRHMNLDVRASVTLEAPAQSSTRVKLEPRYTVTRDQSVQGGGSKPFAVTDKVSFGSFDGAIFPNAATNCQATGAFERDVLEVVRR